MTGFAEFSRSVKEISNSNCEEDIPTTLTRPLFHIPRIAESEMRRRPQLKTNPRVRTITRPTKHAITRPDARNVKYKHRTDRIDIYIVEERVESAACERHVINRFLLRLFFIDLIKLRKHLCSQCLDPVCRRGKRGILQDAVQICFTSLLHVQ